MQSGTKPTFLRKNVAYYVLGAERWRYADTLESATAHRRPLYLKSISGDATQNRPGALGTAPPGRQDPDGYFYNPRDISLAEVESTIDPQDCTDQRMLKAANGKQLVYHSEPFEEDTEITGFFSLSAWLSIDQADTDFFAGVYDVSPDGHATRLTFDWMRARYRESAYRPKLITTKAPLLYEFDGFTFVSRQLSRGHRLRLVVAPLHSIFTQKNYNSGGTVANESVEDARTVNVKLYHDDNYPSVLHVPCGQPMSEEVE
jgi:putative CocE/NonD family hydrolase